MNVVCAIMLFGTVVVSCCESFDGIGNWVGSVPQISAHDSFYPHPHLRDLKAAAKRGKILVITLVVSAGLLVFITTAILKGDKEKEEANAAKNANSAELRERAIAAVAAGRDGLMKSRQQALEMALSAYAGLCGMEWEGKRLESSSPVTCDIGADRVTVSIMDNGASIEVRAVCGNKGASATIDLATGSIGSSIFTIRAMDREASV